MAQLKKGEKKYRKYRSYRPRWGSSWECLLLCETNAWILILSKVLEESTIEPVITFRHLWETTEKNVSDIYMVIHCEIWESKPLSVLSYLHHLPFRNLSTCLSVITKEMALMKRQISKTKRTSEILSPTQWWWKSTIFPSCPTSGQPPTPRAVFPVPA